jgi:hypothetical protein
MLSKLFEIFPFLKSLFTYLEKRIPLQEIKYEDNRPLRKKKIQEKIERITKKDWLAYVSAMELSFRDTRKLKKEIKFLIEWGADIQKIEATKIKATVEYYFKETMYIKEIKWK